MVVATVESTTYISSGSTTVFADTTTVVRPGTISYDVTVVPSAYTYYTTITAYDISVSPAQTTVTVPTASGFTPVKCLTDYLHPTTISSGTYTDLATRFVPTVTISDPGTLTITSDSITHIGSTFTASTTETFGRQTTITVTSTRTDPTSTVYAACATNNVTPNSPVGPELYLGQVVAYPYQQSESTAMQVPAVDPVDCCAACQATPYCAGSTYGYANFDGLNYNSPLICQLYIRNSTVCDPLYRGAEIEYAWPQPILYVSDGPCGQFNVYRST